MQHAVIITGVYPPERAAMCSTEEAAAACEAHMCEMFPHLRGLILVCAGNDYRNTGATPAGGFVRDCVAAYINTGNGRPRPAPGSVAAG